MINTSLVLVLFSFVVAFSFDLHFLKFFVTSLFVSVKGFLPNLVYRPFVTDFSWLENWSLLYWAWWFCWAPFVGLFIARISKGRSVKAFVNAVVFAPSVITIVWFYALGSLGFHLVEDPHLSTELLKSPQNTLFVVLGQTGFPKLLSLVSLLTVFIFYVTSSDSGSYVVDLISSKSKEEKKIRKSAKLYWSILEGILAFALFKVGGVSFVKALMVLVSFPILFLVCMSCVQINTILKDMKS